jgi:Dolichyl-phosphate-mannose-protein mannosyltransferase
MEFRSHVAVGALLAFLSSFIVINLESTPPLWWDEGWTLSVARNWVETGHYGRLLEGQLVAARLQATFPVTSTVALSFRLFGVGVYQARVVGVIFTLGAFAGIYYLARSIYNPSIALATLAVLMFLSAQPEIHPFLMGRQVLGEMPLLFFLLSGHICFLSVPRRPLWALTLTICFWALALITKPQVMPFWTFSMLVPALVLFFKRDWREAGFFGIAFVGSLAGSWLLVSLWQFWSQQETIDLTPVAGLYEVSVLVVATPSRLVALFVTIVYGLPTLLGLSYGVLSFIRSKEKFAPRSHMEVVRLALLVLAGSWFAWYVTLSVGWARYLFPATFIGSIFVAAMLYRLTHHFSVSWTVGNAGSVLRNLRTRREGIGALIAILLIVNAFPRTLWMLYESYVVNADASALKVVEFLNTRTLPVSMIETYDSELFFLLKRPYHYPPDQIHVELNRRYFLGQDVWIDYDPFAADPDYLVAGPHSKLWKLYDSAVQSGSFRLIQAYGRYDIYERVR